MLFKVMFAKYKFLTVAYSGHSKLGRIFALTSSTALHGEIQKMAGWVKARGPMAAVVFDAIENYDQLRLRWR